VRDRRPLARRRDAPAAPDAARAPPAGNWYGCTKTRQEKLATATLRDTAVRFVAICPTGVFGPMLQPGVNATMGWMAGFAKGPAGGKANNDSMSFVDVRDCAAMHVAALETPGASGRYMCLAGTPTEKRTASGAVVYASSHWNEIYATVRELHPTMPPFAPCDGAPVAPTAFDLSRSDALLPISSMRDVRLPPVLSGHVSSLPPVLSGGVSSLPPVLSGGVSSAPLPA